MRLATLDDGTRDGRLLVVSRDGRRCTPAHRIVPTLQAALDTWEANEPALRTLATALEAGEVDGFPLDPSRLLAPLPRAYEWVDGSAYINHIVLVRRARNAEPPATLKTSPLVYQGGSGELLGPNAQIEMVNEAWGLDFEAEIAVVLGDTPRGAKAADAPKHVKLLMLCNDITLRNLIPAELAKSFGFFNSKPASAFSPFAITPDELGEAWDGNRLHLPLHSEINGATVGRTEAGPEMFFGFGDILEHICQTRSFTAGTILGSGTVSNEEESAGVSCLSERRMREIIATGAASTPYLKAGDTVRISMADASGRDLFGAIEQTVVAAR
jgi:fumarylacetoacetate (FAA) hydrolase